MEDLDALRREIDRIDGQIAALFEQRMEVTRQVGLYKLERGLPVLDEGREREVLADKASLARDKALAAGMTELFKTIMAISRRQQSALMAEHEKGRPAAEP